MPILHVAPELAVVLGSVGTLLTVIVLPRRFQKLGSVVLLVALGVAAAFTVFLQRTVEATLTFSGVWALDELTAWSRATILASTAAVAAMSPRWFATDPRHGEWYAMLGFTAAGSLLLAGAADLSELVVAMLLTAAGGYTLASYHRASSAAAEAGAKLYFLGALTNPLLFMGVVLLYGLVGDTGYRALAALDAALLDPTVFAASVALVAVGLFYELGAVPAHPWVPDVAEGSPVPAAAFMTVAPKVAALAATARFFAALPGDAPDWRPAVAIVAALTMTLGNLAALWQDDLRRLLGWSSVSQAGYGLLAVVAVESGHWALPSLILFMVAYAAANLTAFAVVAAFRGRTSLTDYRGLGRGHPWLGASLSLALLSLIGIPPLAGFAAKLTLFGAAMSAGYTWLAVVAVVNTAISVFYYFRVLGALYLAPQPEHAPRLGGASIPVALLGAAVVIALGLGAQPIWWSVAGAVVLP